MRSRAQTCSDNHRLKELYKDTCFSIQILHLFLLLTECDLNCGYFTKEVFRCGYNGYGVSLSIGETSQSVGHSVSTTDSLATTAPSSSSVVYPVASGISQWRGRSPGQ